MKTNFILIKKIITGIIFLSFFSFISFQYDTLFGNNLSGKKAPMAVKGVLDLRTWDFKKNGIIKLEGEWKFYWKKFIFPDDIPNKNIIVKIPDAFKTKSHKLSDYNFGTYYLKILLSPVQESLAFKLPAINSAYEFYINKKMLISAGKRGTSNQEIIPQYYPYIADFIPDRNELDIVVQISDFNKNISSNLFPIHFGRTLDICKLREKNIIKELLLFGILISMWLFYLVILFLRRNEKLALYLCVSCLFSALQILVQDEMLIMNIFPSLSMNMIIKITYMNFYIGVILFLLFLKALLHEDLHKSVFYTALGIGAIFTSVMLFARTDIFTGIVDLYLVFILCMIIYASIIIILAYKRKKKGALVLSITLLFLNIPAVNDILNSLLIIDTGYFIMYGIVLFIFSHIYLLSLRISKTFIELAYMSKELKKLNIDFENKIEERTDKLNKANVKLVEMTVEIAQAHDKLEKLDELKTNFFTNISHEIRTPLTLILSPIELALQDPKAVQTDKKFFDNIYRNTLKLLKLINTLLDFSKLEAGKMKIKLHEIDIVKFLKNHADLLRSTAELKNISLNFIPSSKNINLFLDIEKIEKVMINLFSNALKFTDKGGIITIRIKEDDKNCYIEYEDNGIGISPDMYDTIFDRFGQAHTSLPRRYEGTGIGLSLAKELIELHHGTIKVESKFVEHYPNDHGTIFTITLQKGKFHFENQNNIEFITDDEELNAPLENDYAIDLLDIDLSRDYNELNKKQELKKEENFSINILIVEDNPDMTIFLKSLLERDYRIHSATNGQAGIEMTNMLRPDLIISDIMMPVMNGFEMVKILKQDNELKMIPIILLTARTDLADKIEGIEHGADDYLTKPFNPRELLARIKSLLKTYQLQKELNDLNKNLSAKITYLLEITKKLVKLDNKISVCATALKYILDLDDYSKIKEAVFYLPRSTTDTTNLFEGYKVLDKGKYLHAIEILSAEKVYEALSLFIQDAEEYTIKNNICIIPIKTDKRIVAYFTIEQTASRYDFTDSTVHFIEGIARSLALVLENLEIVENQRLAHIGKMAASIIHDLKIPIGTIMLYGEIAKDDDCSRDDLKKYLTIVSKEALYLTDMINELLEFSSGEIKLNIEEITVNKFFATFEKTITLLFIEYGFGFMSSIEYDGILRIDANRFRRVLLNLAKNSSDAFLECGIIGGLFKLGIKKRDGHIIITASDNGPGIPKEIEKIIYEPFVTYGKSKGLGLGMAIVKKIVEAHKGTISFKSKHGRGTEFTIQLPI